MRQSVRILIATAFTGIVVTACGGAATSQPAAPASQPSRTEIFVDATEFAFDLNAIKVPAGEEVTVTLVNKGTMEHDITVDALGVKIYAAVGKTVSGTVTAAAGTYEVYCSIPGHKQAGMVGTLTAN